MLYLQDTANVLQIKKINDYYPLSGVTTNPTILCKEKKNILTIAKEIRETIGRDSMLHMQTIQMKAEDIIKEAHFLRENIEGNLYIKIPVMPEGIKAIKILKKDNFNITATAIFTANQALMAAMSGADFVAPYVNRIDNISGNGVQVVEDILHEFKNYSLQTKICAASFKNIQQIHEVSKLGVHSVTVGPELFDKLVLNPSTDVSVEQFLEQWLNTFNSNTLIIQVLLIKHKGSQFIFEVYTEEIIIVWP